MKDIRKLKVWAELQKLGFVPIRYKACGRVVAIGASLQQEMIDFQERKFNVDVITIEPHSFQYSKDSYHITGNYAEPVRIQFADSGNWHLETRCNNFYEAKEILSVVSQLKTTR